MEHRLVRFLLGSVLLVLVCHGSGVVPITRTLNLLPETVRLDSAPCFVVELPAGTSRESISELDLRLFENESELGPANATHARIQGVGQGAFAVWRGELYFSTQDNSDPRSNGRAYRIQYNLPIPNWCAVVVLLLACVSFRRPVAWLTSKLTAIHPGWIALGLGLIAAVYRGLYWYSNPALTFDGHIVLGMPFSDGRGWDTMAQEFAQGLRTDPIWAAWGARRPFYYWFFGSIYALTGHYLWIGALIKYLFALVGTVLIFDLVRRVAPLSVAIASAFTHIFLRYDALDTMVTRTEGLGYFLTNLALWFAVIGTERAKLKVSDHSPTWHGALCGIAIGLSNLARPLTIFAGAFIPLAAILHLSQPIRKVLFLNSLAHRFALACFAGVVLVIAPWIVRQHVLYNINSISENSAEMVFAAARPDIGTWSPAISAMYKGDPSDLSARYNFFQKLAGEALSNNFKFYIGNVAHYIVLCSAALIPPAWLLALALGAGVIRLMVKWPSLSARSQRWGIARASAVSAGVAFFPGVAWWWVVGALYGLLSRRFIIIIAAMVFASLTALGLMADFELRLLYSMEWQISAIAGWFVYELASGESETEEYRHWGNAWRKWALRVGSFLVFILVVGASVASTRYLSPKQSVNDHGVTAEMERDLVERVLKSPGCERYAQISQGFSVRYGRVRPSYRIAIPAGMVIKHWSALFKTRANPVVIFETLPHWPETYGVIGGNGEWLTETKDYWFVGTSTTQGSEKSFEIVAAFEGDEAGHPTIVRGCNMGHP